MGNEDFEGDSSNKGEEDERPLKKAKYVWQVKGKYHLKAACQSSSQGSSTLNPEESPDVHKKETSKNGKFIDTFLAKTENILDSDEEETILKNIDKSISNEIPITLVSPYPKNQDYYLRKWQARQIARAYIDNTINSVLETWASTPFDVEDFVDNCREDGQVEDQGILMAIQAHGLQSNKNVKQNPILSCVSPEEFVDNSLENIDVLQQLCAGNTPDNKSSQVDSEYPTDFLNTAVMFAIEKKGLSSFNYE